MINTQQDLFQFNKQMNKKTGGSVRKVEAPQLSSAQQQRRFTQNFQQLQAPIQQVLFQPALQFPIKVSMPKPRVVQNTRIGSYGYKVNYQKPYQPQPPPISKIFNDDETLIESSTQVRKKGKVKVEIKAQRSQVKMGEVTVLPAMCSILSSGGTRTSVDLICVIDASGSMKGQKIGLVKSAMRFLIETLTPSDRLSIITFNSKGHRICGLKTVILENLATFTYNICQITASGGTNIMSGLELALKTMRDRKSVNKVTSVFLLSDGQDKGAEEQLKKALDKPQNSNLGVFSIHSFGFGTDHDEDQMKKICTLKDGDFYFIKQLSTLDEAFINALGGIISLVANQVIVHVRCIASGIVQGVKISKVYGDKWEKIKEGQYRIKLTQLMSEISKDFVFELTIPKLEGSVGDIDSQHMVFEAILSAKGMKGEQMAGASSLKLTLINQSEEIAEINENVDVIENYLRVKAAEVIKATMKEAEANNFEGAQKGIDIMINDIQNNKKARKEKMETLVRDLQLIRSMCYKQKYQEEGRKWMVSTQIAHSNKGNFQYSNLVQTQMVSLRRSQKPGY